MMHHIRPYQIFALVATDDIEDRFVTIAIPPRRGSESLTVFALETLLLISVIRVLKAKSIYEFGVCRGATTLNMALNSEAKITAIDIERQPRDYDGTVHAKRIKEHIGSSHYLVVPDGVADFVFIDGGHDLKTVTIDSQNAFTLTHGRKAAIAWHDYRESLAPDVAKYLDKLAEGFELYHIEDTKLVFWFSNRDIEEKLK